MNISKVSAVYISPAGNVRKTVCAMAGAIAQKLNVPMVEDDFTLPAAHTDTRHFAADELVVFGTPVYAGRIPNKFLPFVQELFKADGALAVPVVCFGNRSYDNALIELRNELESNGFHTIAGAGIVCEHSFSDKLAPGRPDASDLAEICAFACKAAEKALQTEPGSIPAPIEVKGEEPVTKYYTPLGTDGKPAVFLKAKPKTDESRCNKCGICADVCPMGSISHDDPKIVTGICVKCQACIKQCPTHAKYIDDPAFLSHVEMLKENYTRRTESDFFI
jgi:ferredoxin/flavodoxin